MVPFGPIRLREALLPLAQYLTHVLLTLSQTQGLLYAFLKAKFP